MNGFESFVGFDQNDGGMSPEAYEAFREQMRKNSAHIAAVKKGEQKQKKKEDNLIAILLRFIKTGTKKSTVTLISQLLAENIPAAVILSIISLDNSSIQNEINISFTLPEGQNSTKSPTLSANPMPNNANALTSFNSDSLPLKVKIALDLWFQAINDAMVNYPHKTIKTVIEYSETSQIKPKLIVVQLAASVLRDYLEGMSLKDINIENLRIFIQKSLSQMLKELKSQIDDQKLLN